jgi:hypothetical protein
LTLIWRVIVEYFIRAAEKEIGRGGGGGLFKEGTKILIHPGDMKSPPHVCQILSNVSLGTDDVDSDESDDDELPSLQKHLSPVI